MLKNDKSFEELLRENVYLSSLLKQKEGQLEETEQYWKKKFDEFIKQLAAEEEELPNPDLKEIHSNPNPNPNPNPNLDLPVFRNLPFESFIEGIQLPSPIWPPVRLPVCSPGNTKTSDNSSNEQ